MLPGWVGRLACSSPSHLCQPLLVRLFSRAGFFPRTPLVLYFNRRSCFEDGSPFSEPGMACNREGAPSELG
jgi:hypothetical protein